MSTNYKSFDEISYDSLYGEETKCLSHTNDFHKEALNVKLLLEDIRNNLDSNDVFYHYQKYTRNLPIKVLGGEGPFYHGNDTIIGKLNGRVEFKPSVPFTYIDEKTNKEKAANLDVKLNKRACHVSFKKPGMTIHIDPVQKKAYYAIEFIYKDALDIRDFSGTPEISNDYTLEEKYSAVIIKTENVNDFIAMLKFLKQDYFLNHLKMKFQSLLESTKQIEALVFLYQQLPSNLSFLNGGRLQMDTIFNHMKLLAEYDNNSGFFGIFNDESGVLIKALELLTKFPSALQILLSEDVLLKSIYKSLDGSSVIENQLIENKMLFASLLNAIMVQDKFYGAKDKRDKKFIYGNGYKFNGDLTALFSDEKDDEFYLQQLKKTTYYTTSPNVIDDDNGVSIGTGEDVETAHTETEEIDDGAMYHSLDLVTLEIRNGKDKETLLVPAIYIKALSDQDEWIEVEKMIRIGFDILAVIGGIIVLYTTANPGALALAIADIGLATTDIAVQTVVEELEKTKEGKELLETWEKIYLIGGMATAIVSAPQLVQSLYRTANGVIKLAVKVKNYNYINFTRAMLLKAFLEVNISGFTQNTVKALRDNSEIVLATGGNLDKFKVDELFKKSVILVSGDVQTGDKIEEQVALIYKGEAIVQAKPQNFGKAAKDLIKNLSNEKRFEEVCENILNRRKKIRIEDVNTSGLPPTKGVKMYFTLIDEFGNRVGKLSRVPDRKKLIYKLSRGVNEEEINCSISLLDESFGKIRRLPIEKGENLLYADFNIPKSITDKLSGLGEIMLDDALAYFNRNKKYGNPDGTLDIWQKSESYSDYGGKSLLLNQFWDAVDIKKMTYEEAAFETFSGKWAKKNGYIRVRFNPLNITRDEIMLNYIKK
ncbi:hypothetical protein NAT51_01565 [Flavobacterium amniphilum]|uniref:hypothetical protein n=1 Tax=Flavobacterium amniphilum TaxID=1834035 RepID=UPI00202A3E64|nr:hypothetical protein [Flavobacterium amniphilum]MCL9804194.1 hypothetical protein [Flavobacterium amniphilum]